MAEPGPPDDDRGPAPGGPGSSAPGGPGSSAPGGPGPGPAPGPDRSPALRASDADRDRAVATLRDGASEGRLTLDELADRIELAFGATTTAELERLVEDLPAASTHAGERRPEGRGKQRRWNIAIMGGADRRGRWRPALDAPLPGEQRRLRRRAAARAARPR